MMRRISGLLLGVALLLSACGGTAEDASSLPSAAGDSTAGSTTDTTTASDTSATSDTATEPPSTSEPSSSGTTGVTVPPTTRPPQTAKTTTPTTTTKTPATTLSATVRVTVTEGEALTQIAQKLEKAGVCKASELIATANTYDFSYYPLIAAQPSNPNRCFKLEGYLFPDTYEFYREEKPENVLGRFLRNAESKLTDAHRSRAKALGFQMDEILTIASIIEREGANPAEMKNISSILHNRLEQNIQLQCDATIRYVENWIKPFISGDINRYNAYYNTNKCEALPAGPINNPGMGAVNAALYPADTDYLFFCHDDQAHYYYAATYEEHLANLEKIKG